MKLICLIGFHTGTKQNKTAPPNIDSAVNNKN
jgi:hypothetical protein